MKPLPWVTAALMFCVMQGAAADNGQPLAGTSWRLLSIKSMDDAQGTTRISRSRPITLTFGPDDGVFMRLDCNRGTSSYKLSPTADGKSGSLTFGPVAATRQLCPPPHLDERVARDMPFVRSYRLHQGKLYLSLMADGGIYEWAPLKRRQSSPANPAVNR
jgi:heat shock protein HslJ